MPDLVDRFRGCLLGLAVADAIGSPFEGIDAYGIYSAFGAARDIIASPPVHSLTYTDDTQMMIGVAEALLQDGRIIEDKLMHRFAENLDANRGYGPSTRQVIQEASEGGDWRALSRTLQPGGSLGNGAAMRVAPVGLLFWSDAERTWSEARLSALPTHQHPVGIEAAQLVALSVAIVSRGGAFSRSAYFDELIERAETDAFRMQLHDLSRLAPGDSIARFGNTLRADESVGTAIGCFAASPDSYVDTISRAIALGGDTDTMAAIAGSIAGARLGLDAVPSHLLELLEDDWQGRSYIDGLARKLAEKANASPR